jgi:hypothetical protein
MSYPEKRRGWRTITIDEHRYRWKPWPSSPNSRLEVTGIKKGCQRLEVTLFGWQDPWLAISGMKVDAGGMTLFTDAANTPAVIASGFVRELIEFGLSQGWTPETPAVPLRGVCNDGPPELSRSVSSNAPEELESPADSAAPSDQTPQPLECDRTGQQASHVLTRAIRIYDARE